MPRSKPRQRVDDPKAAAMAAAQWQNIVQLLWMRCGGRCEVSGVLLAPDDWSIHHRVPRGAGGTTRENINSLSNLLVVAGHGTKGVHWWIETNREWAKQLGWLLPTATTDVLAVASGTPVVLYSARRVRLDPVGPFYIDVPEEPYWLGEHPYR